MLVSKLVPPVTGFTKVVCPRWVDLLVCSETSDTSGPSPPKAGWHMLTETAYVFHMFADVLAALSLPKGADES